MTSPSNAFQAGIYARLTSYAPLTALVGTKIYDHVPQDETAPYVVIGDHTATDWSTKTRNGWEYTVTIHAWDFERAGRKSVNAILSAIYDALHQAEGAITVAGFDLIQLHFDNEVPAYPEPGTEGAGDHYYHGVIRFRALLQ